MVLSLNVANRVPGKHGIVTNEWFSRRFPVHLASTRYLAQREEQGSTTYECEFVRDLEAIGIALHIDDGGRLIVHEVEHRMQAVGGTKCNHGGVAPISPKFTVDRGVSICSRTKAISRTVEILSSPRSCLLAWDA